MKLPSEVWSILPEWLLGNVNFHVKGLGVGVIVGVDVLVGVEVDVGLFVDVNEGVIVDVSVGR